MITELDRSDVSASGRSARWLHAAYILAGLALAASYLLASHDAAGTLGFPLDDSWIHAQFARNIATGHGFSYDGIHAVSGSTAPAWTVLLAIGYAIARDVVWAAIALGVTLQAASGYYAARLAAAAGAGPLTAAAAGVLVAVTPIVVWGAVSGMEVPLAVALVLAGLHYHFMYRDAGGVRSYLGLGLLGLAALARPENLALTAVVLVGELFGRTPLRVRATRCLIGSLVALVTFAPLVVFSLRTIARPLPTTFYAKSGPGIVRAVETRDASMAQRNLLTFGPRAVANFGLVLLDQFSSGAWLIAMGTIAAIARRERRRLVLTLVAVLVVVPFAMGITAPQRLKPDNVRYAAQLVVLAAPLLAAGAAWLLRRDALAAVPLVAAIVFTAAGNVAGARLYAVSVRNIEQLHVTAGRWIAANLPPDAVVAVNDVGALAFFGGHRVLDLEGLVSPEVLPYRQYPDRGSRVVRDMKPDYLVIFPAWYPDLIASGEVSEFHRVGITGNVISAGDTLVMYRTRYARNAPPNR